VFLRHKQVAGASVTRPSIGFGSHQRLHTLDTEATMEHLPVRIEFVETPERVDELLPTLYDMVSDGLIEVQDTVVLKSIQKGKRPEPARAHTEMRGKAKLVRIFLGEDDKFHGEPLFEAIVKRLRMMDAAGATVYRGILGYGAKGETHKEGWFSRDLPIMISIVEKEERLQPLLDAVEAMLQDGLIVISDVEVRRLVHGNPAQEEPSGVHGTTR
jgi:PII-like signaling protein